MERADTIGSLRNAGTTATAGSRSGGDSKLDNMKATIADKLEGAAGALREKTAGSSRPNAAQYADQAATWLESSAGYIRQLDLDRVKRDVQEQVRQNPGRSLLIAGAAGLVLGFLVYRR